MWIGLEIHHYADIHFVYLHNILGHNTKYIYCNTSNNTVTIKDTAFRKALSILYQ